MRVPDIFGVLANSVRRRILELLRDRPYTVNNLVDEFHLDRPSVSEYLQVKALENIPTGWYDHEPW
jgi:predicted transcriptional regulator